ncbi:hypothetical protein AST00_05565 [Staphylococcus equorum]|uniref:LytTR family DNA-binding domain-containing protein n=1 Tax=Staphylococcus TaxID=1279 RepID=UPI000852E2AB|nr:LytTR family DNA-binding domain-containing protein [Staphylococcus equorum]OEK67872.1 hypothetical protein AST00_05565 [Staphylococcus equorum]OEK72205.1 hypothetical protein AST02_00510 [Staphylococcus equorum]
MKVRVKYNNELSEDEVIIQANENAENLPDIVQYIKQLSNRKTFTGKYNDEIHFIKQRDIICFRMENKILTIYTSNQQFTLNERLYTIKKQLSSNFLQISKSEIINIDYIDHLKLNKNGTIEIRFSNDDFTYSSRRYLSIIKEALKL